MTFEKSTSLDRRIDGVATTNSLWDLLDRRSRPKGAPPTLTAKSLPALFLEQAQQSRTRAFARFRDKDRDEEFTVIWEQALLECHGLVRFLRDQAQVKSGDKVAILSATRYEWLIADLAIQMLGAVSCSVYHSLTAHEAGFILHDSESSVVIAENQEQIDKLQLLDQKPFPVPETESSLGGMISHEIRQIVSIETSSAPNFGARLVQYRDLKSQSTAGFEEAVSELEKIVATVERESLASFVYTSGTTGAPKGVMQTHENHLSMVQGALRSGLLGNGEGIFLYLPLAHSFARLVAYAAISVGGDLIFPTVVDKTRSIFHPPQVFRDLAKSNPTLFPSVPRLFEKVMDSLQSPETQSARLAQWAIQTARELQPFHEANALTLQRKVKFFLAQKILTKARRSIFGNQLRYCISGGAPISVEVLEFFKLIGVTICEGYGLTETTPAMAANIPQAIKFGTVGKLFDCNEVRIASDGEIEVRGGNVAKGYWKLPQATAEAWDSEGWFRTGDIGDIDEEGFLRITDRKKDLIVTAGGKKIPPAYLEGKLKNSPLISQAVVCGDRKSYLVALLTLNEQGVRAALKERSEKSELSLKELSESEVVISLVDDAVAAVNSDLASYEQIKRFHILPIEFTLDGGLLTPSLKLKRKLALERYQGAIEALYQGKYGAD